MNIIGKKYLYFLFSLLIILPGVWSLFRYGLRPGIDFSGGTLFEITVKPKEKDVFAKKEDLSIIISSRHELTSIQESDTNNFIVRTKTISHDEFNKITDLLAQKYGDIQEKRFETIGPTIGKELTSKAINSLILASLMIIIYIAWAFREVPKPYSSWKFGICAVIALIHDILVVTGLFSIFGHFYNVEIDSLFVSALLTIIGFSVHDTIVVFDRIRENLKKMPGTSFTFVVNESILQTLTRSLSTSLTVIFTLTALLLFGGETIRWFVVALLIGIISGTYSSIFNAAPLLVLWEERKSK